MKHGWVTEIQRSHPQPWSVLPLPCMLSCFQCLTKTKSVGTVARFSTSMSLSTRESPVEPRTQKKCL
jgi:hypothetical protein